MSTKVKSKRLRNTFLIIAAIIGGYFAMGLFYVLPDMSSRSETHAIADGTDTTLGREFAAQTSAHPGKTGVHLLGQGRDAFVARAVLSELAEKSIDVQYYMYHQDTVGGLLTYELLKAADRGVRVRLLIDDIYGNVDEDTWLALDAHPSIEVRFFNPWVRGRSRLIQSVFRVRDINSRMHVKTFTVDNQAAILGGRNIGDEYFDADKDLAFSDLDVLTVGPPVAKVSDEFDTYWNSDLAYPVNILVRQGTTDDLEKLNAVKAAFFEKNTTSAYVQALKDSDLAKAIRAQQVSFDWATSELLHDSPEKRNRPEGWEDELLITHLTPYISNAKKTVDIVSPYFVPGKDSAEVLCKLAQDGVRVRILTNSLASNDVSAVHAGYAKYRRPLLRCGVELYELDEALKEREGKFFTWLPGLKKSSLHAKTMVFDGETMLVGSFNFDQRSQFLNNEIGLVFTDPKLAGAAAKRFEDHVNEVAFKVEFSSEDGTTNMHWTGGQGGPDVVMEKEPYATTLQKLTVGILKWLPIDSQL